MAKTFFVVLVLFLSLSDSVFSDQYELGHNHHHHHHRAPATPKPPCEDHNAPSLAPVESPFYFPSDSPADSPIYFPSESPVDSPVDSPIYFPSDSPIYFISDSPVDSPADSPIYFPSDSPVEAPADSPIQIWSDSPYYPPADSPAMDDPTPAHFPRSHVAVQGLVYCMSCKCPGTFENATPIQGAVVKLRCKNTWFRRPTVTHAETDKNGFFYLEAPRTVTSYAAHTCKVKLVWSPLTSCSKPTGFGLGSLRPVTHFFSDNRPFTLYSVGPLAFGPICKPN